MISRFHYLTQDLEDLSHVKLIQDACERSDVNWIQLRVKNESEPVVKQIAYDALKLCQAKNIKLIINDYVDIAVRINADGVHLGKNDMTIQEARQLLGPDKIIGGTANTLEDIKKLSAAGANYIGVGPFRFTETKANLSKVLGLEGYQKIVSACKNDGINIPIIAIGGIKIDDVTPIMNTGIHGIAVSSAVNLSEQRNKMIDNFLAEIRNH